jgi:hypothetical protein
VILTAGSFGPTIRYEATSRPRSASSTHVDLILAGFLHYHEEVERFGRSSAGARRNLFFDPHVGV